MSPSRERQSGWTRQVPNQAAASRAVEIVLADLPEVRWTIRILMIEGQPQIIEMHYASAKPSTGMPLDWRQVSGLPLRRLASLAARALNLGPDGRAAAKPLNPWQLLVPQALPRRPDGRRRAHDPERYSQEMAAWSAPIAEVVRTAAAQMRSIQGAVSEGFGVGERRAEELIALAREYHDLPSMKRPASPAKPSKRSQTRK